MCFFLACEEEPLDLCISVAVCISHLVTHHVIILRPTSAGGSPGHRVTADRFIVS